MNPIDRLEIHELLARTVYGLDQRDPSIIEPCFTEDANFLLEIKDADEIPPFEGRETIMGLMIGSMNDHTDDRRHIVSNIFIESEAGDTAVVVSSLVAVQSENGEIGVMTSGVYRDKVSKLAGKWQISERHLALDVPF